MAALTILVVLALGLAAGCAKYNTYYNAERAYNDAEHQREELLKAGEDVTSATSAQKQQYQLAIKKAQKILDDYPGHSLTDDVLYLQGKSYQRIASYRMSIRKLDLLFTNFPQTSYLEEAIFLQAVNYLMLGDAGRSQDLLDRLDRQFPDSRFQSEALRSSGDNAYAMEDWEDAVTAYERFFERFPDADKWDDSSLRLAESLFELERYDEAITVLERVVAKSTMADRVFRARLMQSRARVRDGNYEGAETLIAGMKADADIYGKLGDVTLVEAENLLAQGERGAAMTLLEGMSEEHITTEVKPVRAELLGKAFLASPELANEDLEEARVYYQEAMSGRQRLEDPEVTSQLLETLKDYLAAEGRLPDADPERAAGLRLLQANAMLFGFERPRRALDLYVSVAADTAADSLVAPRALYGARLIYEVTLQDPDSAAIYDDQLQERYPQSPQAYHARSGAQADLLGYLLEREEEAMLAAQAAGIATGDDGLATDSADEMGTGSGLRRRQIYLQRRMLLVYPPPEAAVIAFEERQRDLALAVATADSTVLLQEAPRETLSFDGAPPTPIPIDSLAAAAPDTAAVMVPAPVPVAVDTAAVQPEAELEAEPEEEPEEEKPRSWDF